MSDTIFRQAVRLIESDPDAYPQEWNDDYENGFADALNKVLALPSAQPEIIRCKDCKWFRKKYGWNCNEYTVCGISPTHYPIRREDDFCSRAERRTDE